MIEGKDIEKIVGDFKKQNPDIEDKEKLNTINYTKQRMY